VLLSTENEDGSFNLAPMSSAWALGQVLVLGVGVEAQTSHNLRSRHDLVVNLPATALAGATAARGDGAGFHCLNAADTSADATRAVPVSSRPPRAASRLRS
jgi:flavin reductase (DIM6/NTAB) family NADH-FMN oxidoreductase RutF